MTYTTELIEHVVMHRGEKANAPTLFEIHMSFILRTVEFIQNIVDISSQNLLVM